MRLYNEVEETTKVVVVEDYATFNGLLKCKYLFTFSAVFSPC